MTQDTKNPALFSGGTLLLLLLMAIGGAVTIYRLVNGLGAATNLSDEYPWGLWVAVDVLTGVALAAGGFGIAAAVYIFNMKKYKPVAKPAILTAFIGYLIVIVGLVIDIGKPASFWHPLVMWQGHSVMFEVVWCITLYTTVLALEFAPDFLDKVGMGGLATVLRQKVILYPLVIAGITLSYLHQSSLGAFFLITPHKLHGLWYSPLLPQLFYLSAIAVGLAMVSFESIMSSRAFHGGKYETDILKGLAKGTWITLTIYLVVRVVDLLVQGNVGLIFTGGMASLLFLLEVVGGVILPIFLLATKSGENVSSILWAQILVIAGVILNRFNVNFLTQTGHGGSYFPSVMEMAITVGIIALGIFLYRAAVAYLPIFSHAEK